MICLNYNASMKSQWPHFKAHLMLQTHHQLPSLSSSNKLENPPFYFAENCQGISLGSLKEKEGSRLLTTRWASLIKFLDFPSQKWIPKKRASMSQPLCVSYTRNTLRNHPGPAKVCRSHGQHNFSWACFLWRKNDSNNIQTWHVQRSPHRNDHLLFFSNIQSLKWTDCPCSRFWSKVSTISL